MECSDPIATALPHHMSHQQREVTREPVGPFSLRKRKTKDAGRCQSLCFSLQMNFLDRASPQVVDTSVIPDAQVRNLAPEVTKPAQGHAVLVQDSNPGL